VLRSFNLFCEYASLIRFKFTLPNTPRPFNIPGETLGAILIALPTLLIVIFCLCYTEPFALEIGAGVIGFIVLLLPIKKLWVYTTHKVYLLLSNLQKTG